MNARVMRAGIAGGAVMAVFSMVMLWLAGSGFWTPLNLIAHTFWRAAPLDGRFRAPALVIGAAMHMTMAMLFGILIAAAAFRLPAARSLVIAGGMLFAALLWTVMQYGIWRAIDAAAARDFTPWVFAVAHLLFGMAAAMFAAIVVPDADAPPRHALPRQPAGPRNWLPRPRGAGASQSAAGSELSSGQADAGRSGSAGPERAERAAWRKLRSARQPGLVHLNLPGRPPCRPALSGC